MVRNLFAMQPSNENRMFFDGLSPVRVCLFTVRVCLFTVRVCFFTVRVCLFTVRVCLFTVRVCLFTVRVCLLPVRVCLFTVRVCLFTVRVCLFTVRVCLLQKLRQRAKERSEVLQPGHALIFVFVGQNERNALRGFFEGRFQL